MLQYIAMVQLDQTPDQVFVLPGTNQIAKEN